MRFAKWYYYVFRQSLVNSTTALVSFRTNFVLSLLFECFSFCIVYMTVDFIFRHVTRLGPWGHSEFMLFASWIQMINCLHTGIISINFWTFSSELRNGRLDYRLLRPGGALFCIFTAIMRPTALIIMPLHICVFIFFGCDLSLTLLAWCMAIPLFLLSFILMVLIELCIAMGIFWTIKGEGWNLLRIQRQQLQRWPDFMYPHLVQQVFTYAVPVLLTTRCAMRFLLNPTDWIEPLYLILATTIFWLITRFLWMQGLQRYQSAS